MRVVIDMNPDGTFNCITDGPCEVFAVCEWTPNDRVYRLSSAHTVGAAAVDSILGDSEIGHAGDARHEAVRHKILAAEEGQSHLKLVEPEPTT